MVDEKLISIIICDMDGLSQGLLDELAGLEIPDGKQVDVQVIRASRGNLAAAYNTGIHQSNAKYRFFIDESARYLHKNLIPQVLRILDENDIGVVGFYGSEMPLDGIFTKSKRRFGRYAQYEKSSPDKGEVILGENPLWIQKVHCLDGRFLAVSKDIAWDEMISDNFAAAALCMRYRNAGYKSVVPMQDSPWMIFGKPSVYALQRSPNLVIEAKRFFEYYWDTIQPLVSVLIPTYNQPHFFEKALKSALEQDYKNIEIVVGDDSTNEETKHLMEQKYLDKYPQIRYFFHGKPLGGHGIKNIDFVLNHAEGEYVSFLFHDDIYYRERISRMVACYEEDLDESLGIVTSTRDAIDENDKVLGRFNPWLPAADTLITGAQMAEGIFSHMTNIIGELTTVLLRKKFLKQKQEDTRYRVGIYCGVVDTEFADISTFLEMCRAGRSCMFLKDTLSAFRIHPEQNTGKLNVAFGGLMEWFDYLVLSWVNGVYIHTWEQLTKYLSAWRPWALKEISIVLEKNKGAVMPETYTWCNVVLDEIGKQDYEKTVDLLISYMMDRVEDKSILTRVCHKNEKGLWCKR